MSAFLFTFRQMAEITLRERINRGKWHEKTREKSLACDSGITYKGTCTFFFFFNRKIEIANTRKSSINSRLKRGKRVSFAFRRESSLGR